MAANPAPSLRVELGHVDELHRHGANGVTHAAHAANTALPLESVPPFAALAARQGRPLRIAILSDFTRIPYANGAAFQTRFLYQELRRCGHEVTVIGPHDPDARPEELAPGTVGLPSVPLKTYPGLRLPMPTE